jgi:hypothetical protein
MLGSNVRTYIRDAKNGHFLVSADQRVADSKVLKTTALQGYALAEYREGLEEPPTQLPWVQQYIDHFRNVVMPCYPSLFTLEDCPSYDEANQEVPTPCRRRKRPAQSSSQNTTSPRNENAEHEGKRLRHMDFVKTHFPLRTSVAWTNPLRIRRRTAWDSSP